VRVPAFGHVALFGRLRFFLLADEQTCHTKQRHDGDCQDSFSHALKLSSVPEAQFVALAQTSKTVWPIMTRPPNCGDYTA
jgi:hypothetical protein